MIPTTVDRNRHTTTAPRRQSDTVQELAQRRLRESAYAPIRKIRCDFHEGVLTLRGYLPTFYLMQVAQTLVVKVEGVQLLNNRIVVESYQR